MNKKPPMFSPKEGSLIPCGELKPHDVTAEFKDGVGARLKAIFVDEAGILWDISHPVSSWELKPVEWPKDIRANYVIAYKAITGQQGSMPITADNYEAALKEFREHAEKCQIWVKEDSVHLKMVSAPFPFHEFDKKAVAQSQQK